MMRAILVLCGLLAVSPVWAADYYVSTTGNNANTCAQAQNLSTPKQTINHLRDNCSLKGGDTVFIRGGTYAEEWYWWGGPKGTDWNSPITFRNYPNETVTIRPNAGAEYVLYLSNSASKTDNGSQYLVFDGLIFDESNTSQGAVKIGEFDGLHEQEGAFPARHIRFTNFRWTGASTGRRGGILVGGSDVQMINGEIDHIASLGAYPEPNGIYGAADDMLVDNVHIHDIGGYGISAVNSTAGVDIVNNVVKNSRIHNNVDGVNYGEGSGHLLFNNLIYNNTNQGLYINAFGAGTSSDIKLYNNTAYGNGLSGISVGILSDNRNTILRNNISYGNGTNYENDEGTTVQDHNLIGIDPLFVNAAGGDFRLQSGSPAIDAGTTLADVTTDVDGVSRPQGTAYDIGAYESGGVGDGGGGEADPPSEPEVDVRGRIRVR